MKTTSRKEATGATGTVKLAFLLADSVDYGNLEFELLKFLAKGFPSTFDSSILLQPKGA